MIHVRDDGVVLTAVKLHGFSGAREWSQRFVPPEGILTQVERMLREKVGWDFNFVLRVEIEILRGRLPRIVWSVEAEIDEERSVSLGSLVRQVVDDPVCVDHAGVLDRVWLFNVYEISAQPVSVEGFIRGIPCVARPGTK